MKVGHKNKLTERVNSLAGKHVIEKWFGILIKILIGILVNKLIMKFYFIFQINFYLCIIFMQFHFLFTFSCGTCLPSWKTQSQIRKIVFTNISFWFTLHANWMWMPWSLKTKQKCLRIGSEHHVQFTKQALQRKWHWLIMNIFTWKGTWPFQICIKVGFL